MQSSDGEVVQKQQADTVGIPAASDSPFYVVKYGFASSYDCGTAFVRG